MRSFAVAKRTTWAELERKIRRGGREEELAAEVAVGVETCTERIKGSKPIGKTASCTVRLENRIGKRDKAAAEGNYDKGRLVDCIDYDQAYSPRKLNIPPQLADSEGKS